MNKKTFQQQDWNVKTAATLSCFVPIQNAECGWLLCQGLALPYWHDYVFFLSAFLWTSQPSAKCGVCHSTCSALAFIKVFEKTIKSWQCLSKIIVVFTFLTPEKWHIHQKIQQVRHD